MRKYRIVTVQSCIETVYSLRVRHNLFWGLFHYWAWEMDEDKFDNETGEFRIKRFKSVEEADEYMRNYETKKSSE